MKQKQFQTIQLKLYFVHIVKHFDQYYNEITQEYFEDSPNLSIMFKVLNTYYTNNNTIPTPKEFLILLINEGMEEKNIEIAKKLLNTEEYNKRIQNSESQFLEEFERFRKLKFQNINFLNDIEKMRGDSINIDYLNFKNYEVIDPFNCLDSIDDDVLISTPIIPTSVYEQLPDLLKELTLTISEKRDRDMFFTSMLSTLTSLFPNVYSSYYGKNMNINLFTICVAPASAGKGIINRSVDLLNTFLKEETENNKIEDERLSLNKEYKQNKTNHMLAANSSSAALISNLAKNRGTGLIHDTEIDTLVQSFKQDWGDFSSILRQSFENETIRVQRKDKDTNIQIDNPSFSVSLAGTKNQLFSLFKDSENGLYSRFLFYIFNVKAEFKNPFSIKNYKQIFQSYSQKIYDVYYTYNKGINIEIKLTQEQEQKFFEYSSNITSEKISTISSNFSSVINRYSSMTMRIIMLITLFRKCDSRLFDNSNVIYVEDIDFYNVIELMKVYFKHSELIFLNLENKDEKKMVDNFKDKIFKKLKNDFTRNDVLNLFKRENKSVRIADEFIKDLKEQNLIEKIGKSNFKKIIK
jgi:hypothetical protein